MGDACLTCGDSPDHHAYRLGRCLWPGCTCPKYEPPKGGDEVDGE